MEPACTRNPCGAGHGTAEARKRTSRIQYIESENPTTSLLNGCITFHKYLSPFNPAEDIEELVEFDPNAISDALGG